MQQTLAGFSAGVIGQREAIAVFVFKWPQVLHFGDVSRAGRVSIASTRITLRTAARVNGRFWARRHGRLKIWRSTRVLAAEQSTS
jgi:hypothetical protein